MVSRLVPLVGVALALLAASGCGGSSSAHGGGADAGADTSASPDAGATSDAASPDAHGPVDAGKDATGDASPTPGDAATDAPPFATAAHEPWPVVKSQGGPVLKNPTLVAVVPQNHTYASELQSFGQAIPTTTWWSALSAEYDLGTMKAVTFAGASITGATDEASLVAYLQDAVTAGSIPGPDGHTVYLLFVPSAATIAGEPCASFGGYHDTFPTMDGSGNGDSLALVVTCGNDSLDPSPLDFLTQEASHEVAEAITDPLYAAKPAWIEKTPSPPASGPPGFQNPTELGDLCSYTAEMEQGFVFQRIWSVAAAAAGGDPCIPASATGFYDVTQQPGTPAWLPIAAGKSVKIPLVGWATTAETPSWWLLSTYVSESSAGLASATTKVSSAKTGTFAVACGASPIADNGGAAGAPTVTVTAPSGAASGTGRSWRSTATGRTSPRRAAPRRARTCAGSGRWACTCRSASR